MSKRLQGGQKRIFQLAQTRELEGWGFGRGGAVLPPKFHAKFHTRKTLLKHFGVNKLPNIWKSQLIKLQLKKLQLHRAFTHLPFSGVGHDLLLLLYACLKLFISVTCLFRTILHRESCIIFYFFVQCRLKRIVHHD